MQAALLTFSRHLVFAARWGFVFGLLFGHVDLAVRISAFNLEWFEVYQALLITGITGSAVFVFFALILHSLCFRRLTWNEIQHFYTVETLFLLFVIAAAAALNQLIFQSGSFWEAGRLEANIILMLVLLTGYFIALRQGKRVSLAAYSFSQKIWRLFRISDYIFFITFFALASFAFDYYAVFIKRINTPLASPSNAFPNIIFISLDTLRADHLSIYGYQKETSPFLSGLAAKSVVFENAYSSAAWTLPAHAGIFTGKYPSKHGAHFAHQKLDPDQETLAEILYRAGYHNIGYVGGPYCRAKYGLAQGFQEYRDRIDFISYRHTADSFSVRRLIEFLHPAIRSSLLGANGEKLADEINSQLFADLPKFRSPFFLFINYFDTHDPYDSGDKYRTLFTSNTTQYEEIAGAVISNFSNAEIKYQINTPPEWMPDLLRGLYDSEIRWLDDHIKTLIEQLEKSGKLNNTVVVFFSDHGEEFFEHGGLLHGDTLYQEILKVPLMIYAPQLFKPSRVSEAVSTIDLFATVLELLKLPDKRYQSVSLLPQLSAGSIPLGQRDIFAERAARPELKESGLRAVIQDYWKLIEVNPPQERIPTALFDLHNDPKESINLYSAETVKRNSLSALLK